jgi:PrcB C-terminal
MWRYAPANPDGKREGYKLVLKTAADLVAATPFSKLDAPQQVVEKMATAELAKMLKVDNIDWTKQMLIVVTAGVKPSGGFSVDITSLKVADKTLTVAWKINPPKGLVTQAFTHPGQVVLVPRFEGEVKFAAPGAEGKGASGRLVPEAFESPAREAPARDEKPAGRELKVLGQANARIGAGSTVIRSAKDLAAAEGGKGDPDAAVARIAKLLKVDAIDFDKQMIVVISGGVQRSGGYSVQVNKIVAADKTATVHWKLNTPKPGQPVTLALTNPTLTVLVERFDGDVRFDPPPPKGKGGRFDK